MSDELFEIGDGVRLTCTFRNAAGTKADPTGVSFKKKVHKTGTPTTFVYGTDAEVVKSGTGVYYIDVAFAEAGTHFFKWYGTGAVQAAKSVELEVGISEFEVA